MAASHSAATPSRSSRPRTRRGRSGVLRRFKRWRKAARSAWRRLRQAPPALRGVIVAAMILVAFSAVNFVYQVVRKPVEMFFPVSGVLAKTPAETWRQYAPLFHQYATADITPELLAALAQVEGSGNPLALTYWRWRLSWDPFAIYGPASSAVGMYQMTNAAFADARHYCIRHHVVVATGCWLNSLYTRVLPSDAVELTAVFLDRSVTAILARRSGRPPSLRQKEALASIIHLCGSGPGEAFARRGFRLANGERCGDHDPAAYLAEVDAMERQFRRLAGGG